VTAAEINVIKRQATRYLVASEQDRNPAIAYLHAAYAVILFDTLKDLGYGSKEVTLGLRRAQVVQDRSGSVLFRCVGGVV